MQPLGLSQELIFFGKISKNLLTRKGKGIKKESLTYRKGEILSQFIGSSVYKLKPINKNGKTIGYEFVD